MELVAQRLENDFARGRDTAADDDRFGVEQPAAIGQPGGELAGELIPHLQRDLVAGGRGGSQPGRLAFDRSFNRARRRVKLGRALGHLAVAGVFFQAAGVVVFAGFVDPFVVDAHLPDLSGRGAGAAEQLAVEKHRAAHPGAERDGDEVLEPAPRAVMQLGEAHTVGVVLRHRGQSRGFAEDFREVNAVPSRHVGQPVHEARRHVGESRHADAERGDGGEFFAQDRDPARDLGHRARRAVEVLGDDRLVFANHLRAVADAEFEGRASHVDANGQFAHVATGGRTRSRVKRQLRMAGIFPSAAGHRGKCDSMAARPVGPLPGRRRMAGVALIIMRLKPITGLVPAADQAAEVAAVPYDVVDRAEAAALAAGHPHNLLHVDRAEIDLPPEIDPYDAAVYAKARENFLALQAAGVLVREPAPALYFYRQVMGAHAQTGIIGGCHVEDYETDVIKKHEKTRQVKEDDRTRLVSTLGAHTGPVFLTYRDVPEINALQETVTTQEAPLFDFTADDGIRHTVWRVTGERAATLARLFAENVPVSYVADGHHRSASAARVAAERRAADPASTGEEDYHWFLGVLFPATQLRILPYNRVVTDLRGDTPESLLEAIAATGLTVTRTDFPQPTVPENVHLYLGGGRWYALGWPHDPAANPIDALDVSVLQNKVLGPLLGIDDPRTSERIEFIGGIRGTEVLERKVDGGGFAAAFSMYPTTVDQLMAIADAGQIMPPKSTWFEPKLRSGLVVQTF